MSFDCKEKQGPVGSRYERHGHVSETNWYVITGAPSSGKTTLLKELEELGYRVIHEVARAFIEMEMEQGQTLEKIRADKETFENRVLHAKIALEERLPKDKVIIFDRAIPDSIPYFELAGLDTKGVIEKSPRHRYKKVFVLDRLPYAKDQARIEDQETAAKLDRGLEAGYRTLGYEIKRIGVMPVQDRLRLILQEIEKE
jgi:predicted ATPase